MPLFLASLLVKSGLLTCIFAPPNPRANSALRPESATCSLRSQAVPPIEKSWLRPWRRGGEEERTRGREEERRRGREDERARGGEVERRRGGEEERRRGGESLPEEVS